MALLGPLLVAIGFIGFRVVEGPCGKFGPKCSYSFVLAPTPGFLFTALIALGLVLLLAAMARLFSLSRRQLAR
ncbi:MAG: hypothetical protein L3K13_07455 [Thermoplasmata archaeon]|nr:hypothetical protein [Thermoplasmata archaeon]